MLNAVRNFAETLDINTLATTWLLRHARNLSRGTAITRCAAHLVETQEVSLDTAERVALQALAELESTNQRARIDLGASTAHVVVVHRPNGKPLAFTLCDLLRLHAAKPATQEPAQIH